MSESETSPPLNRPLPAGSELAVLKQILLSDERESLSKLEQRVKEAEIDADKLTELLPRAVRQSVRQDNRLAQALGPMLVSAFRDSVKRNPQALAEAVSPIMGPAIRRSIRQTLAGMIQSLNKTLEYSLSWRGMKWRWEALRTGRSFGEVVMLNALIYKVEQVFLVHRETGLLLANAATDANAAADADLLSAMLTALRDFGQDSLGIEARGDFVSLEFSDDQEHQNLHLWPERGPRLILGAVVRGQPPAALHDRMRQALDTIQVEFGSDLDNFDGENQAFESAQPILESCLVTEYREDNPAAPTLMQRAWRAAWLVPAAACVAAAIWGLLAWRTHHLVARCQKILAPPASVDLRLLGRQLVATGAAHRDWVAGAARAARQLPWLDRYDDSLVTDLDASFFRYVDELRRRPGLVVTRAERQDGRYYLEGLRDPLAEDPVAIMRSCGLASGNLRSNWIPFRCADPVLASVRLREQLPPAPEVTWTLEGNQLQATGSASHAWLSGASAEAQRVADILSVDLTGVENADLVQLQRLVLAVESRSVLHEEGEQQPRSDQSEVLSRVATEINDLVTTAGTVGDFAAVLVVGYADPSETVEDASRTLSEKRARSVWRKLVNLGVAERHLLVRGGRTSPSQSTVDSEPTDLRRCMFQVRLGTTEIQR